MGLGDKKIKVALIYPGISWSGFDTFGRQDGGESNFIHHGLASMAAVLVKNGYEVEYIDLRQLKNWQHFGKVIKRSQARIFGISSTTVDFGHSIKAAAIIKKSKPRCKVVVGGVHPTVVPKDALDNKVFDCVVTGEGEKAILDIVKLVETRKKLPRMIVGTPYDLEGIPHIDRDLFGHIEGEMVHPFVPDMKTPFATVMSSRGCPYGCTFCQPAERMIFGGKVRLRPIKDVVEEIKEINGKYGLSSFLIHDDLFIISKERIEEFVRLYKQSGIKATFMCQARADLIIRFEKEMKLLREAGLTGVMIGFESGSQRVLDFLKKNVKVEQNLEAGRICHKLGIKVWANYMFGIPGESYWEMMKTAWMIRKISPQYYSPSLFTPYPQTGLYDYCQERDLLIFKSYDEYRRSLSGNKIKGFNYTIIRGIIFFFMPLPQKWNIIKQVVLKV